MVIVNINGSKNSSSAPFGIPSHDTFGRVFARLNPEQLQDCFLNWVKSISSLVAGEIVAIDGKTLLYLMIKVMTNLKFSHLCFTLF